MQILLVMLLLPVCCVAPGLRLLRSLDLRPIERLVAAIALSLVFTYVGTFALFAVGAGARSYVAVLVVLVGLALAGAGDARQLIAVRRVRRVVLFTAILWLSFIVWLAYIRHYSGAFWEGDWQEHYERALVFRGKLPPTSTFLDLYSLTARPPLQNVLSAFFMTLTGDSFAVYQVICTFLAALVLPAAALAMNLFGRRRRAADRLLLLLLLFSPAINQNATYPWTKLLCAFFVVASVAFLARSATRRDPARAAAAGVLMAAGLLTHYGAGPYAVFAVGYAILNLRAQFPSPRTAAAVVLPAAALLLTWFGYAVAVFGLASTMGSNTTVTGTAALTLGENISKIVSNLYGTFVPLILRQPSLALRFVQESALGMMRDGAFIFYQTTLWGIIGSLGGICAVICWITTLKGLPRKTARAQVVFVAMISFLGVAAHPTPNRFGLAHIDLLPLALLALALLACRADKRMTAVILAGCVADWFLGIMIHMDVQNRVFSPGSVAHGWLDAGDGYGLFPQALRNWTTKEHEGYVFLGDLLVRQFPFVQIVTLVVVTFWMALAAGVLRRRFAPSRVRLDSPSRHSRRRRRGRR